LNEGDSVISINGHRIRDSIDFQFYIAEEHVDIEVNRNGSRMLFNIEKEYEDDLGICLEDFPVRRCTNKCIFCFIDQNPDGMRNTLYVKDGDYRLSFLYGNYITLTNVKDKELERIITQRLSPIYISVHALDLGVREILLGTRKNIDVIDKIEFLTSHGIELHGQVVLCPGINDGEILKETVYGLIRFFPQFRSLSVVPVGITKHRQNLFKLRSADKKYCRRIVDTVTHWQNDILKQIEEEFVYLADEFYIVCEDNLPPMEHYGEFWQLENGVGLTRKFLEDAKIWSRSFPEILPVRKKLLLITGTLACQVIEEFIVPKLNAVSGLEVKVLQVVNDFYGPDVTVSGLLTAGDITKAVKPYSRDWEILLPPDCVNNDNLFLDDWTVEDFRKRADKKVNIFTEDFFKDYFHMAKVDESC